MGQAIMTHRLQSAAVALCLCTVTGIPSATQAPRPGSTPTAAITGVVVDAASGAPVAGADVWLRVHSRATTYTTVSRQLSDGRGRFAFTDLAASTGYVVVANAPAYLEAASPSSLGHLVVADGQWLADVRIRIRRAGSIAGAMVDEQGEPLVGAHVRLLTEVTLAGARRLAAGPVTVTNDRGAYRFGQLAPGRYLVVAPFVQGSTSAPRRAPATTQVGRGGGTPPPPAPMIELGAGARLSAGVYVLPTPDAQGRLRAYPTTFHPGATALGDATPVELGAGDERSGVDLRVQPVSTVRVAGRVDGPPEALTNLMLRLVPSGLEDLGGGSEAATTVVDADGTFAFLNVPAGRYTLHAPTALVEYSTASAPRSLRLPPTPGRSGSYSSSGVEAGPEGLSIVVDGGTRGAQAYAARVAIDVGPSDLIDVRLPLRALGTITGRVVVDPEATPGTLPSFNVHLEPATGDPSLGYPRQASGPDAEPGTFTIGAVQPGAYVVGGINYNGWLIKSVTIDGRDFSYVPIDTMSSSSVSGVVVTFTNRGATLTGQLAPSPGADEPAVVVAFPAEEAQWTGYGLKPLRIRSTAAASDGTFTIEGLPAGAYLVAAVRADSPRVWQQPGFFARVRGEATPVSLTWGGRHTAAPRVIALR